MQIAFDIPKILMREVLNMANNNNGGGLSFWGMVGAVLVALIIFAVIG